MRSLRVPKSQKRIWLKIRHQTGSLGSQTPLDRQLARESLPLNSFKSRNNETQLLQRNSMESITSQSLNQQSNQIMKSLKKCCFNKMPNQLHQLRWSQDVQIAQVTPQPDQFTSATQMKKVRE